MSKFGECEGYTGEECEQCGRIRVEHYSKGVSICEKCRWCKELGNFVTNDDLYDDEEYRAWWKEGTNEGAD